MNTMKLHDLASPVGATTEGFRIGRGIGSGNGKTCGKGHKGAKARSGYASKRGFEGGQMPLHRRLPKRGFNNIFAEPYTSLNVSAFNCFEDGTVVGVNELIKAKLVDNCKFGLKILGGGELTKKVTIQAAAFSEAAMQKITAAGAKAEVK